MSRWGYWGRRDKQSFLLEERWLARMTGFRTNTYVIQLPPFGTSGIHSFMDACVHSFILSHIDSMSTVFQTLHFSLIYWYGRGRLGGYSSTPEEAQSADSAYLMTFGKLLLSRSLFFYKTGMKIKFKPIKLVIKHFMNIGG